MINLYAFGGIDMFNVAICDDDKELTVHIEEIVYMISREQGIDVDVDVYWNGKNLADDIVDGERYDIIYLDIEMKEENGIDAARRLRQVDQTVLIIYVSSYEAYAIETFELRPFRFVVKPICMGKFREATIAAIREIQRYDTFFHYQFDKMHRRILLKKIIYFESNKRKVTIVSENGAEEMYGKLNELEEELKNSKIHFLRIHQSYLVSYLYVKEVAYDSIVLTDNTKLPISEERRKYIRQKFIDIDEVTF